MTLGYIKLHRKFKEWEWYKNIPTKTLFIELLLECNYALSEYNGQTILPGQVICSYKELADNTGLTIQQVRTALRNLISTREITRSSTQQSTRQKSLITVVNWGKYQVLLEDINTVSNTEDEKKSTRIYKNIKKNKEYIPPIIPLKKGGRKKRNHYSSYDINEFEKMLAEKE